MKEVWLHLPTWNKELVTASLESGIDAILTDSDLIPKIRELGRINLIAQSGGDRTIPDEVEVIVIRGKDDERRAVEALKSKTVVVRTTDWDIIPIENLIPQGGERLFTFVRNIEEARVAAGILERGVAGVVLETNDPLEIGRVSRFVRDIDKESFQLGELTVTAVKTIGLGDRVCVDTCSNLRPGEGLLVGNSNRGMFLIHAENIDNPYVAPRPFRVNAGPVHSYVRVPGGKTRYLGELKTGDQVLVVDSSGNTSIAYVGRSKIEKRPLLVVYAEDESGEEHSVVLQNAETIRLVGKDGSALSVADIKPGDRVMAYLESGGRHFGMSINESILEQ